MIFAWIFEEIDDFDEFGFCLVDAGDVGKRDFMLVWREHFAHRSPKPHRLSVAELGGLAEEVNEDADEEERGQRKHDELQPK